ncbi:MAG TPA: SDR family NAD(P)-dependent oxidoreductase, partial [Micromonosporaceae bacterium]|nr:SDR family NAD(P)-dependent oxidoreductase [Micromonosporaceae bacterium]
FTGQGSQSVDMARTLYESEPVFTAALDRCAALLDGQLDRPLAELLFPPEGSDADEAKARLDQTGYTQPVLFAVEWSLAQLWQHWGVTPDVVLGHSVGELVAACVAGVMSLEDGLRLVTARGQLMGQLPAGGAMLAVTLPPEKVTAYLAGTDGQVVIAAHNSPTETVIAGPQDMVDQVGQKLAGDKVKTTRLHVSHAFHSPLMRPILPELQTTAEQVDYHPPQRTLVSNVTGQVAGADIVTASYWREHVMAPVRFATSVATAAAQGVTVFQEIGPHPVLLGAARQCLPEDTAHTWLPSLRRGRDDHQQLLTSLATLYTRGITPNWDHLTETTPPTPLTLPSYPFQHQRYWLDTSRLRQRSALPGAELDDWLYELAWRSQDLPATVDTPVSGSWLVFADASGAGESVAELLRARGDRCQLVFPSEQFAAVSDGVWQVAHDQPDHIRELLAATGAGTGELRGILHLWSLDSGSPEPDALHTAHARSCASLLHLVQSVAALEVAAPPRIWAVTRGAQAVGDQTAPGGPYQAPLWGLGNVVGLEHPTLWGGLVDLDPAEAEPAATLLETVESTSDENQVAWRGGQRHVARVAHADRPKEEHEPLVRPDGTYLVTGGLGALGMLVARWLVDRGARHVVLTGRSGPSDTAEATLRELEARDAQVRVLRADVSREADVTRLLHEVEVSMPPLRGVFHAAGVLDDGVLHQQSWERFTRVFAPKVSGAWHLHMGTRDLPLDHFVLFSSIASLLGSPGQGNYAAANAFLDALAHHRRSLGLPGVSINWGAWGEAGMAADLTGRDQQRWAGRGIGTIPPEQGIRALELVLASQAPQTAVMPVDWDRYAQQYPVGAQRCLLAELVDQGPDEDEAAAGGPGLREQIEAMPAEKRHEALVRYVAGEVAQVLMLDAEVLDPHQGMFDMGMDSLMALELKNRVQAAFGHELPSTLLFNYPTIEAVAKYLQETVLAGEQATAQPEHSDHLESLLGSLEQLSDEEIDRLFADRSASEGRM